MKDLLELREEIDRIDNQIVSLYEERMKISEQVAEYKISTGKKVFDKERETQKLDVLSKKASNEFMKHGIIELFEQIMSVSRKKQYQLLSAHGLVEPFGFEKQDSLFEKKLTVVFQGVEGAYSQQAMQQFFPGEYDSFHVETWRDAMEAIQKKQADFAVLPLENSSAGIVSENYDLLAEYDAYIVGEQILKIDHALLGLPEANLSEINTVYSHPQALMQCGKYLEEHRNWEKISLKNTAMSAQKVKNDNDPTQVAIASAITAELYGLKVLDEKIQDNQTNCTRFVIVSGEPIYQKDASRIALCFELPHTVGSLYHTLSHFIYNNINMTNIQSRPKPDKNWEYRFFIDVEGTLEDEGIRNAMRGLEEETSFMKILGTY
ncbi:MAG: prephenate dehydratase [Lachnospiraceae bacterium]|nr:prephenate dehydratase [Lachnospiraceae bacterium]